MARPKANELTERELEIMHVFWRRGESTAAEIRRPPPVVASTRKATKGNRSTFARIKSSDRILIQVGSDRFMESGITT